MEILVGMLQGKAYMVGVFATLRVVGRVGWLRYRRANQKRPIEVR